MEIKDMKIEEEILSTNTWGIFRILNERLMDKIAQARDKLVEGQDYSLELEGARDFLSTLITLLRIEEEDNDLRQNLRQIYLFTNKLITLGHIKGEPEELDQALGLIRPLYQAFSQQEASQEVNVVSGLTYGRQDLYKHGGASKLNIEG